MNKSCYVCKKDFEDQKNDKAWFTDEKGKIFQYDCCKTCINKTNKIVRDFVRKNAKESLEAEIEKRR